jgi:ferredoxin-nitrite reductase
MAHTKTHALELADYLEPRVPLDSPINIHLTGCPHSCAQHYMGDIGLLATKIEQGDDMVEGYHVFVGGGYGAEQGIGRELYRNVTATDLGPTVERMLRAYLENRATPTETFLAFCRRHETDQLKELFAEEAIAV